MRNEAWESGFMDIHAHILPGLDDGPKSIEAAKALLLQAREEGICTIVATSHYRPRYWRYTREEYARALDTVRSLAREIDPDFLILEGNEIFNNGEVAHHLKQGHCLPLPGGHALVEFSPDVNEENIFWAADSLIHNGYIPLLAHVERYRCIQSSLRLVRRLVEAGAWIQVNTGSLTGGHCTWVEKRTARRLLRAELIDVVGTDCHDATCRPALYGDCAKYIKKCCSVEYSRRILVDNPRIICGLGEEGK